MDYSCLFSDLRPSWTVVLDYWFPAVVASGRDRVVERMMVVEMMKLMIVVQLERQRQYCLESLGEVVLRMMYSSWCDLCLLLLVVVAVVARSWWVMNLCDWLGCEQGFDWWWLCRVDVFLRQRRVSPSILCQSDAQRLLKGENKKKRRRRKSVPCLVG